MSELRSAIEGFRSQSLSELPDAHLCERFGELRRAAELIELERLRHLAEIERRRLHEHDGHLNTAAWLVSEHNASWGAAREQTRLASSLAEMPKTARGIEEGDVSMSAARVLSHARDADPDAFSRSEEELVQAARDRSVEELRRVAATWREAVHANRGGGWEERLRARRWLRASTSFEGMVRVAGDLDPETGESLLTALRAVLDAESRSAGPAEGETRSPAQARADGLGEICRGWMDLCDRPTVAGERPHVTITVGADALANGLKASGGSKASGEADHVGVVSADTARYLACDASAMRVVLAGDSEPLDVGRRTKVVPPSMRRAIIVRDRSCRFPGCERPHPWCDAHHVAHWADGGPTAASNLILLCRRHHRLVHRPGGFGLELSDGRPVFRRPDGSVLEDPGPRSPPYT